MCTNFHNSTHCNDMACAPTSRSTITLMAEAQKASGHATKKQTVEEALRLMIKLRGQQEAGAAFGKYRWRGNLARSRKGRGTG